MRTVIVPNFVSDAINAKLDAAFAKVPDAAKDREALYQHLLAYFGEHGVVPDFELQKREAALTAGKGQSADTAGDHDG